MDLEETVQTKGCSHKKLIEQKSSEKREIEGRRRGFG